MSKTAWWNLVASESMHSKCITFSVPTILKNLVITFHVDDTKIMWKINKFFLLEDLLEISWCFLRIFSKCSQTSPTLQRPWNSSLSSYSSPSSNYRSRVCMKTPKVCRIIPYSWMKIRWRTLDDMTEGTVTSENRISKNLLERVTVFFDKYTIGTIA